jgi:hypothetical protein
MRRARPGRLGENPPTPEAGFGGLSPAGRALYLEIR